MVVDLLWRCYGHPYQLYQQRPYQGKYFPAKALQ